MSINSKSSICNLSIGSLGNLGTIDSIETPTNSKERTFALWYDICRQFTLKLIAPNFALKRGIVAKRSTVPAFGYAYQYEYPVDCLKVLGIGNVKDKENNYAVEGNNIMTDELYEEGLPVRYIEDVEDVNRFSPEYKLLLSQYIAAYTCLSLTQDEQKARGLKKDLPAEMSVASGMNAQENMPIRINRSKYKQARYSDNPQITDKK